MIRINIDGQEIKTHPGYTIKQVAAQHGIIIPTLCEDDKLKSYGSCGLCVVEVRAIKSWTARARLRRRMAWLSIRIQIASWSRANNAGAVYQQPPAITRRRARGMPESWIFRHMSA